MTTQLAPTPLVSDLTFEAVQALTVQLHDANTELTLLRDDVEQYRAIHEADIALIGARLLDEATNRGCYSLYDTVIDELNRQLAVPLPSRERSFDFTCALTLHITATALTAAGARSKAARIIEQAKTLLDYISGVYPYPDKPADFHLERRRLSFRVCASIELSIAVTAASSAAAATEAATRVNDAVARIAGLPGVTLAANSPVTRDIAPF